MGRHLRVAVAVLLAAPGLVALGPTSAASAQTFGPESFTRLLVVTRVSGQPVELASHIRVSGLFDGTGKIVELPPQPGDPDNMDRDDLVFPQGTLHLFSFVQVFQVVSSDPNSCRWPLSTARSLPAAPASLPGRAGPALAMSTAAPWRNATRTAAALSGHAARARLDRVSGLGTLRL